MFEDAAAGRYRKLVIADGRIVGAILLGHGNDVAAVRTAITRGFDVTDALDALRAGRWDALAKLSGASRSSLPLPPKRNTGARARRLTGHAAENPPPARRSGVWSSPPRRRPTRRSRPPSTAPRSRSPATPRPTTSRSASTPPASSRTTSAGRRPREQHGLQPGRRRPGTLPNNGTITVDVNAGGGNDTINLSAANLVGATINGEAGDDIIVGSGDADTINGGDGNDRITGFRGDDDDQRRRRQRRDDLEQRRRQRHQQRRRRRRRDADHRRHRRRRHDRHAERRDGIRFDRINAAVQRRHERTSRSSRSRPSRGNDTLTTDAGRHAPDDDRRRLRRRHDHHRRRRRPDQRRRRQRHAQRRAAAATGSSATAAPTR